ncbi:acetyl-CoA hydrolase/transferase family protein, partial [bacterium]|nr:acetyl-CoA hydrolase/transferase family protein [bacterium]
VTAEEAVKLIKSGDRIHVHPGCANPETLIKALVKRAPELENVELIHLLTLGYADYVLPQYSKNFHHRALFVGANCREAVNEGRADFIPIFLSEISSLYRQGKIKLDVALLHLSPPDSHGFCSLGVGIENTKAAAETAKLVIAQINPNMPRTLGDSFVHVSKLDAVVEVETPVVELPRVRMTEQTRKIGENVAALIEDGSTLQMGIGGIPDAVLYYLKDKKDLGIHTEMFSDGIMELVEQGIINNEKKSLHPGKIVSSFILGSRKLYDFVNNNPIIEFHPSEYVNDPFIVAQNDNMVAINSAIQIDLTGQVCSDSMGRHIFSGIGGQVDFIRGSARSKGGKPVIAIPSTAKDGAITRIVPTLTDGAGVVTSRGDVHYVVTEFGAVDLFGKSIRERTRALISIADPKFREQLEAAAKKMNYL